MAARFHVESPLGAQATLDLPDGAARHVQVLRMQPGMGLTLFDGHGGEWSARILAMGRQRVEVELLAHDPVERELATSVTLVAAMPANDRFDWLVEKATELGVAAIEPVMTERSVLRLSGERAQRKQQHWQAVAVAAAEQCGRTRVPRIGLPVTLATWLGGPSGASASTVDLLLSLGDAVPLAQRLRAAPAGSPWRIFSGPEGGYAPSEEQALRAHGAQPTHLGERVLRAETAPLAVLASIATMLA